MKYQDIIFLQSVYPIKILDKKPSIKTDKLINTLLADKALVSFFNSVPAKISIKKYIGKDIKDIKELQTPVIVSFMQAFSTEFFTRMNFSCNLKLQLLLLIFFNSFIDLDYIDIDLGQKPEFIVGKKQISARLHDYEGQELASILIPLNISKSQLSVYIDKNWKSFQSKMDKYIQKGFNPLKINQKTKQALEIIEMRDIKQMAFIKIADKLNESEDYVKNLYHQYKKQIKKESDLLKLFQPPKKY